MHSKFLYQSKYSMMMLTKQYYNLRVLFVQTYHTTNYYRKFFIRNEDLTFLLDKWKQLRKFDLIVFYKNYFPKKEKGKNYFYYHDHLYGVSKNLGRVIKYFKDLKYYIDLNKPFLFPSFLSFNYSIWNFDLKHTKLRIKQTRLYLLKQMREKQFFDLNYDFIENYKAVTNQFWFDYIHKSNVYSHLFYFKELVKKFDLRYQYLYKNKYVFKYEKKLFKIHHNFSLQHLSNLPIFSNILGLRNNNLFYFIEEFNEDLFSFITENTREKSFCDEDLRYFFSYVFDIEDEMFEPQNASPPDVNIWFLDVWFELYNSWFIFFNKNLRLEQSLKVELHNPFAFDIENKILLSYINVLLNMYKKEWKDFYSRDVYKFFSEKAKFYLDLITFNSIKNKIPLFFQHRHLKGYIQYILHRPLSLAHLPRDNTITVFIERYLGEQVFQKILSKKIGKDKVGLDDTMIDNNLFFARDVFYYFKKMVGDFNLGFRFPTYGKLNIYRFGFYPLYQNNFFLKQFVALDDNFFVKLKLYNIFNLNDFVSDNFFFKLTSEYFVSSDEEHVMKNKLEHDFVFLYKIFTYDQLIDFIATKFIMRNLNNTQYFEKDFLYFFCKTVDTLMFYYFYYKKAYFCHFKFDDGTTKFLLNSDIFRFEFLTTFFTLDIFLNYNYVINLCSFKIAQYFYFFSNNKNNIIFIFDFQFIEFLVNYSGNFSFLVLIYLIILYSSKVALIKFIIGFFFVNLANFYFISILFFTSFGIFIFGCLEFLIPFPFLWDFFFLYLIYFGIYFGILILLFIN